LAEYKNPQNDPGSQQRMLLLLVFFFITIVALQYFLPKPQPQPQPEQQKSAQQAPAAQTPAQPTPGAPATATPGSKATPASTAPKVPVKAAEAESETVLENDYYRAVFTNRGGVAKSWVLKKFKDNNGKPLELVNPKISDEIGYPLSLFSYDKALEKKLKEVLYVTSSTASAIRFEYSDGETTVSKIFRAAPMYVVGMEIEVTRNGQRVQAFPQWPGGLGDLGTAASYSGGKIDFQQNGNIEHKAAVSGWFLTGGKKWIVDGQTFPGPFEWVATADQYFAAAFMPESPKDAVLVTLHNQVELPKDPNKPNEAKDKVSVLGVAVGNASGLTRQRLFAGPKTQETLQSTLAQINGPNLSGMTDFGFFGFIAKPLFLWLRWTYQHWIPDWGWSIAFLTLVITLALFPLRLQGMKSALRMQKIQPQMKALQEKYKRYSLTDPRRADMQKEMSELYKREGVNPVGGCFPMLLQMPFLFAFYSMLQNAIELRQASWLWIHDLSAPDPLHILPIIIIVTMFFSQRSMPQAGMDPTQQKMMNLMGPIMLGVISWSVAAGLCVYWAISNLLGYVQQVFINRSELGQQVRKGVQRRTTRKR
jgi:YidC/Oxa1 family membrane protein insertase